MNRILFVNQENSQCGVYQFGKNTASILLSQPWKQLGYSFEYLETDIPDKLTVQINSDLKLIIFNHHPCTMGWLSEAILKQYPTIKSAVLMHDECIDIGTDAILHPDPTFIGEGKHFRVGRPIFSGPVDKKLVLPNTIGSFGFGFDHKGFPELIDKVNQEFDYATIRMHIPLNTKVDISGYHALNMNSKLKKITKKPGINLEITHDYKTEKELLEWLSQNTINAFLYRNTEKISKGCSSTIDWALAARRPIAFTNDPMFRHINAYAPNCNIDNGQSLKEIISFGIKPLEWFYENWTNENLFNSYLGVANALIRT